MLEGLSPRVCGSSLWMPASPNRRSSNQSSNGSSLPSKAVSCSIGRRWMPAPTKATFASLTGGAPGSLVGRNAVDPCEVRNISRRRPVERRLEPALVRSKRPGITDGDRRRDFLIALALIASERVHRTKVALLGAAIVVLFVGGYSQEKAIEAVDFNTIGLLAGMMILVYLTQQTGVYDYIAIRAGQLSKGRPLAVVLSLAVTTAVLSAFLDNLTTILLDRPGDLPARRRAGHRPDSADRDRGDRLEHRRHRDADRRPAEHHHRRGDRPQLQRASSSTSRRSRCSPS